MYILIHTYIHPTIPYHTIHYIHTYINTYIYIYMYNIIIHIYIYVCKYPGSTSTYQFFGYEKLPRCHHLSGLAHKWWPVSATWSEFRIHREVRFDYLNLDELWGFHQQKWAKMGMMGIVFSPTCPTLKFLAPKARFFVRILTRWGPPVMWTLVYKAHELYLYPQKPKRQVKCALT